MTPVAATQAVTTTTRIRQLNWILIAGAFVLAMDAALWLSGVGSALFLGRPGGDFIAHRDAAATWLASGGFYDPRQLAGPYDVWAINMGFEPILYPPIALIALTPFTALPAVLWWVIPLAIVGWVVWQHRSPARLALVAALCLVPTSITQVFYGNPEMWVVAILALATRWPAAAPWVLVKPSLFPFAAYRIDRRAWWAGLAVLIAAAIPFGHLWIDWLTALLNSRQDAGLLYSVWAGPPMLIPLAATAGRDRSRTGDAFAGAARSP